MKTYNVAVLGLFLLSGVRYTEQAHTVYDWEVKKYENGTVQVVNEAESYEDSKKSLAELKENVGFVLYTNENPDGYTLYLGDDEALDACTFNSSRPTIFVIHGWNNRITSTMCVDLRDVYLKTGDYNVILINWDNWSSKNYVSSRMNVAATGQFVAVMIDYLVDKGMNPKDLTVVGHSLGGHISGVACRNATSNVGKLIALDPAGPLFVGETMNARLTKNDADCVEVIHTSGGWLGYGEALGDYDYWPNGGSSQEGCGWDLVKNCAHGRSYELMKDIIELDNLIAQKCDSYDDYKSGNCGTEIYTHMGYGCELGAPKGNYYLNTNGKSPFAKN